MQVPLAGRQGAAMNAHLAKLKAWYGGLQERERRVVLDRRGRARGADPGGRNAAAAAVGGLGRGEARRRAPRGSRLDARERRRKCRRERDAGRTTRARRRWWSSTGSAGRPGSARRCEARNRAARGVRVQLEAAPFDTLVSWIATLDQRYGLSIDRSPSIARPGPEW